MNVLAPNMMGDAFANRGIDNIILNTGLGVSEIQRTVNPQAMQQRGETTDPEQYKNQLRIAKARQFGTTKGQIDL